jgi:hypothetical protein
MIEKYPQEVNFYDALALILHDAIEDHPECWWDILTQFGTQTFRDILILSKISNLQRREILEWLTKVGDHDDPVIIEILQILNPVDPMDKFENFSRYKEDILGQDSVRFKNALQLYKMDIIDRDKNPEEARDEYVSLGNYLYFQPKDARRKLQDMLHNMSDMSAMEITKPGYIEKRRIKAYILGVKLKNFGMFEEYADLQAAFR